MKSQKDSIRLYVICWGILSIIGGSCLTVVSFWRDKAGEWVGLIPYICAALMSWLLRISVTEADGTVNLKPNRLPVKKTARTGRGSPDSGKVR